MHSRSLLQILQNLILYPAAITIHLMAKTLTSHFGIKHVMKQFQ